MIPTLAYPATKTLPAAHRAQCGARLNKETGSHGTIELLAGRASASVSLWGGQLMSYRAGTPAREVLWTGPYSTMPGRDCWGGVPLCWPWFGTGRGEEPLLPFHGPARQSLWTPVRQVVLPDGRVQVALALEGPVKTSTGQSIDLGAVLTVTLGNFLRLELETRNTGRDTVSVEQCFHSYFLIGDVGRMRLEGLEGTLCRDNRDPGCVAHTPQGPISFNGPASRLFEPFPKEVRIVDDQLERTIVLRAEGASNLVLWNSGPLREENGRPTGEADWRTQIALEPLRGLENAFSLPPGETLNLAMEISVE